MGKISLTMYQGDYNCMWFIDVRRPDGLYLGMLYLEERDGQIVASFPNGKPIPYHRKSEYDNGASIGIPSSCPPIPTFYPPVVTKKSTVKRSNHKA